MVLLHEPSRQEADRGSNGRTKLCGWHKVEHPVEDFALRSKKRGTRKSWCKQADKVYDAERYKNRTPEEVEKKREHDRQVTERNRKFVWDFLLENPCIDCGETHPILLEFDHNKKEKKIDAVSNLVRRNVALKTIVAEIAKCVVRCVKCHRLKTAREQGWYKDYDWV